MGYVDKEVCRKTYRATAYIDGRHERGPHRSTKAEADADLLQARGSQTQSGFRDILRQLREAAQRANSSNSGDAQPAVAADVGTEHGAAAVMKQQCIAEELDKRIGPAPVGTMEEALADRARANKRIRELRKESKNNPVCAGATQPTAPMPSAGHEQSAEARPAKRRRDDPGSDGVRLTPDTLPQMLPDIVDAAGRLKQPPQPDHSYDGSGEPCNPSFQAEPGGRRDGGRQHTRKRKHG